MAELQYNRMTQEWMEKVVSSRGRDAHETLMYTEKIKQFGEKTEDDTLLGFAYYYIGETYYMLNDIEAFLKNIIQALEYLQRSKQWQLIAKACNLLGIASGNQGNAPFALDYYLNGVSVCERHHMPYIKAMIEYNI
jgi:tetratricopeptide (TPR) repeat protein